MLLPLLRWDGLMQSIYLSRVLITHFNNNLSSEFEVQFARLVHISCVYELFMRSKETNSCEYE